MKPTALPANVVEWIEERLRKYQGQMLEHFPFVLTPEEGMSVVTTAEQRKQIKTVWEFIAVADNISSSWSHSVELRTKGPHPLHFNLTFNHGKYLQALYPSDNAALATFYRQESGIKDAVLEHVPTLGHVALLWAQSVDALHLINHYASTPEQVAFYCPWVRIVVERGMVSTKVGEMTYDVSCAGKGEHDRVRRIMARLHKPKLPGFYLTFTQEQREYLRIGDQAFAQWTLLGDPPRATQGAHVSVSLSKSRAVLVPRAPFEDKTATPLYK